MIDPARMFKQCKRGHWSRMTHDFHEQTCPVSGCGLKFSVTGVHSGPHPYLVWGANKIHTKLRTFTCIPMSSKPYYEGMDSVFTLDPHKTNGLTSRSHLLCQQVCSVEPGCFKDPQGDWIARIGLLNKENLDKVAARLYNWFDLEPSIRRWARWMVSPDAVVEALTGFDSPQIEQVLQAVLKSIPEDERERAVEELLNNI